MSLNLFKAFTGAVDTHTLNTDLGALFNAFAGIEAQTSTLAGLTITPDVNSTTVFKVTNAAGTSILSVDTVSNIVNIAATVAVTTFSSDLEITDDTKGLILKSPNATRWRIQVGNDGALSVTSL